MGTSMFVPHLSGNRLPWGLLIAWKQYFKFELTESRLITFLYFIHDSLHTVFYFNKLFLFSDPISTLLHRQISIFQSWPQDNIVGGPNKLHGFIYNPTRNSFERIYISNGSWPTKVYSQRDTYITMPNLWHLDSKMYISEGLVNYMNVNRV